MWLLGLARDGGEDERHALLVAIHGLGDARLLGGGEGGGRLVDALGEALCGERLDERLDLGLVELLADAGDDLGGGDLGGW